MDKEILNVKNPIKWTWYLFLFANIILILGVGIAWAIMKSSGPIIFWYIPIVVCSIVAVIAATIFYYFETRELFYLKMHVPKKCFYYYLWSGVFFVISLLFIFIMTTCVPKIIGAKNENVTLCFALMFGICAFLTLISIGLYRYGKFRIEMAIYKRRHGEIIKQQENVSKEKTTLQNLSNDEINNKRQEHDDYSSITTPTSNLVNNVDKEQKN